MTNTTKTHRPIRLQRWLWEAIRKKAGAEQATSGKLVTMNAWIERALTKAVGGAPANADSVAVEDD